MLVLDEMVHRRFPTFRPGSDFVPRSKAFAGLFMALHCVTLRITDAKYRAPFQYDIDF